MELLVAGIYQCPQCRKIVKLKEEKEVEEQEKVEKGDFLDGDYFHKNYSLNKQYEVAETGIIINKSDNGLFAVLICHSGILKDEKYVRLSWWKSYQHAGMFKIYDKDVLKNVITALEKFDQDFDDIWTWKGKFGKQQSKTKDQIEKEKNLDIIKYRIIENRTCPRCSKKMEKLKSHYECQHCGEIVVLEGYNQPIFNIPSKDLDITFRGDFPINFYLPVSGITVKWLMGEWKAIVVIYSPDNPDKKWLRFYWWVRDLSKFLKYGQREMGENIQMGWKAQKGSSSPNIYDKKSISPLIESLKKIAVKLNWED
jgi:ribosomal protein L37AE/L43A